MEIRSALSVAWKTDGEIEPLFYSECAANTDVAYQTFFNCYRSRYKFPKNRFYDLNDMSQSLLWRMDETFFSF